MNVCNKLYNESNPKTLGVKIRLFVTVWKITDDTATPLPVSEIAINFGIRLIRRIDMSWCLIHK